MPYPDHSWGGFHTDYEDEGYLHYPELSIRRFFFFFNLHFQLKSEAVLININLPSAGCHYYQMENSEENFFVCMF